MTQTKRFSQYVVLGGAIFALAALALFLLNRGTPVPEDNTRPAVVAANDSTTEPSAPPALDLPGIRGRAAGANGEADPASAVVDPTAPAAVTAPTPASLPADVFNPSTAKSVEDFPDSVKVG